MNYQDIKNQLLNGQDFFNEAGNWWTVTNPEKNMWILYDDGEPTICRTVEQISRRVNKLMKQAR